MAERDGKETQEERPALQLTAPQVAGLQPLLQEVFPGVTEEQIKRVERGLFGPARLISVPYDDPALDRRAEAALEGAYKRLRGCDVDYLATFTEALISSARMLEGSEYAQAETCRRALELAEAESFIAVTAPGFGFGFGSLETAKGFVEELAELTLRNYLAYAGDSGQYGTPVVELSVEQVTTYKTEEPMTLKTWTYHLADGGKEGAWRDVL